MGFDILTFPVGINTKYPTKIHKTSKENESGYENTCLDACFHLYTRSRARPDSGLDLPSSLSVARLSLSQNPRPVRNDEEKARARFFICAPPLERSSSGTGGRASPPPPSHGQRPKKRKLRRGFSSRTRMTFRFFFRYQTLIIP
ncbi:hypothetical protein Nepgr_006828 [Nepenthes gracilis]|uniref:Uncharacterized protein n=1 Tax=Nepenthes gracilis TaxID=150966 RepID=A0AAD3S5U8_NEPGR|nr:hypothetical protein Nepgr_006828 [Nepenthes gracilis]